jgi:methylated-DNA-[protein]-cysteine S-methyltransferase
MPDMKSPRGLSRFKLTEFQKRVLIAVYAIPKGETRSYKQIAEQIGSPRACRAVGNALNKNPLPVFVPCHRVVGSNGKIGGYKSGTRRKMALLRSEGAI